MKHAVWGLIVCLLLFASSAMAEETVSPASPSVLKGATTKLGRGFANLMTGWLEIPKQIHHVARHDGALAAVWRGTFEGVGMFVVRTVAGMYEMVTFPFPLPPRYQPMFEPPYVWQPDPAEAEATEFNPAVSPSDSMR